MQTEDFRWFIENMPRLFEAYGHCFLVIRDKTIFGVFDSYVAAVKGALKTLPAGEFIVQECGQDERAYTNYISSADFLMVSA